MANHFSALKRMRQDEKRTLYNRRNKTRLRHAVRDMRRALASKNHEAALTLLPATYSVIDRSAKSGVIKKNTAARYKGRLVKRLKAIAPAAP
jgi:small subunit ribosomal protein S20